MIQIIPEVLYEDPSESRLVLQWSSLALSTWEVLSSAEHSSLNTAPFVILLLAAFLLKITCPYAVTLFDNLCSDGELNFLLDEICRYMHHVFSKLAWPQSKILFGCHLLPKGQS